MVRPKERELEEISQVSHHPITDDVTPETSLTSIDSGQSFLDPSRSSLYVSLGGQRDSLVHSIYKVRRKTSDHKRRSSPHHSLSFSFGQETTTTRRTVTFIYIKRAWLWRGRENGCPFVSLSVSCATDNIYTHLLVRPTLT